MPFVALAKQHNFTEVTARLFIIFDSNIKCQMQMMKYYSCLQNFHFNLEGGRYKTSEHNCLQSFKGRWNRSEACAGISAWRGPTAAENWPVTPETGQSQFTDGKLRGRHWLMGKTQLVIVAGVIPARARTLLFPPLVFHQAAGWNNNLTIDLTFCN